MDDLIRKGIVEILQANKSLLKIPIRQKAKFEGWLKFELAHWLENQGAQFVEVESKVYYQRSRTDITFSYNGEPCSVELKTPNTNWNILGVVSNGRPITKNIPSIIKDAFKLNSIHGVVAFVLFPVPSNDNRWENYLKRINYKTKLGITKSKNCEVVGIDIDGKNKCDLVVCVFKSKRFTNWY
jgi:hypothetical protein